MNKIKIAWGLLIISIISNYNNVYAIGDTTNNTGLAITDTSTINAKLVSNDHNNDHISAEDRFWFIGANLGLSEPVVKSFKDRDTKARFKLKGSNVFGVRGGYSFYPSMMVEVSGTYQPRHTVSFVLPEKDVKINGAVIATIPTTPGETKIAVSTYTMSLVYTMHEQLFSVKPYVIVGGGIAKIVIQPTVAKTAALAPLGLPEDLAFFRIKKNSAHYFAWKAGAGIIKDINDNLSIDLGVKLRVINNIKVRYDTFNPETQTFIPQDPIKKSIGVAECTIGLIFKIPS